MDQINSIAHLQRAKQLISSRASKKDIQKAYMHIRHALMGGTSFGSLPDLPLHIVKYISSALGNPEKIYALMATDRKLNDHLKPFVLPQEWMSVNPKLSNVHANAEVDRRIGTNPLNRGASDVYEYYCKDRTPRNDAFEAKVRFLYSRGIFDELPEDNNLIFDPTDFNSIICNVNVNTTVQNIIGQIAGMSYFEKRRQHDSVVNAYHSKVRFTIEEGTAHPPRRLQWGDYDRTPLLRTEKITDIMRSVCDNPIVFVAMRTT